MTEDTRPLVQVVAGILLDKNGRYLLSSRPEGKPYAGYWEFAGGKVEAGESDFQALQREFEDRFRRLPPCRRQIPNSRHTVYPQGGN